MNIVLKCFAFLLLVTSACEKDKGVKTARTAAATAGIIAGMGSSMAKPAGRAFVLPKGVVLTKGIYGDVCNVADGNSYGMTYARVALCIGLRNTTGATVDVRLPQGLVFTSASTAIKNGLLPREIRFTLLPRQERLVRIGALCVNPGRNMPSGTDRYTMGPVCNHPALRQFYSLFNRKRIYEQDTHHQRDFDAAIIAQSLLWKLVDSAGLAREDIALAKSLTDIN